MGILTEFLEMNFDFLVSLKTTLDVRDYELKVRMVTRMDCFYLAMFRHRERVWNKQGVLFN